MPSIEITQADFMRLQKLAVPLIDTPSTIVRRLLDHYEGTNGKRPQPTRAGTLTFEPGNLPLLAYTKLLAANFDGATPDRTKWDSLVRLALVRVMNHCRDVDDLRRLSGANIVSGEKTNEGYKFISDQGFSYQGLSAEDAAKVVIRCARAIGCSASFEFEWRDNVKAHMPGKRGVVEINSSRMYSSIRSTDSINLAQSSPEGASDEVARRPAR